MIHEDNDYGWGSQEKKLSDGDIEFELEERWGGKPTYDQLFASYAESRRAEQDAAALANHLEYLLGVLSGDRDDDEIYDAIENTEKLLIDFGWEIESWEESLGWELLAGLIHDMEKKD